MLYIKGITLFFLFFFVFKQFCCIANPATFHSNCRSFCRLTIPIMFYRIKAHKHVTCAHCMHCTFNLWCVGYHQVDGCVNIFIVYLMHSKSPLITGLLDDQPEWIFYIYYRSHFWNFGKDLKMNQTITIAQ